MPKGKRGVPTRRDKPQRHARLGLATEQLSANFGFVPAVENIVQVRQAVEQALALCEELAEVAASVRPAFLLNRKNKSRPSAKFFTQDLLLTSDKSYAVIPHQENPLESSLPSSPLLLRIIIINAIAALRIKEPESWQSGCLELGHSTL